MARAMLSKTGEVEGMWMPTIKTHAFVIYATQEQAEATLAATMDKEWPQGNHSRLVGACPVVGMLQDCTTLGLLPAHKVHTEHEAEHQVW